MNNRKPKTKLNANHLVFIDEYIKHRVASRAYATAYQCKPTSQTARTQSSLLLNEPVIIAEIEIRKQELRDKANIQKEDIVNKLIELAEQCETDKDKRNLLKAYDMINKMTGTYQDKIDITSGGEKITGFSIEIIKPK